MSSQYSIEDKTAETEFLVMGGRSFDALEPLINASEPPCGRIKIIHECEYIGWEDIDYPEVRYDGTLVAEDAEKIIAELSGVDPQMRLGGADVRLWIESFEELTA